MIRELTHENFAPTIAAHRIVLAFLWTDCGLAREFWPNFEVSARRKPHIVHGSVDLEAQPRLADEWPIDRSSGLLVFRDSILVLESTHFSLLSRGGLSQIISDAERLDMARVRQRVEENVRAWEERDRVGK